MAAQCMPGMEKLFSRGVDPQIGIWGFRFKKSILCLCLFVYTFTVCLPPVSSLQAGSVCFVCGLKLFGT